MNKKGLKGGNQDWKYQCELVGEQKPKVARTLELISQLKVTCFLHLKCGLFLFFFMCWIKVSGRKYQFDWLDPFQLPCWEARHGTFTPARLDLFKESNASKGNQAAVKTDASHNCEPGDMRLRHQNKGFDWHLTSMGGVQRCEFVYLYGTKKKIILNKTCAELHFVLFYPF